MIYLIVLCSAIFCSNAAVNKYNLTEKRSVEFKRLSDLEELIRVQDEMINRNSDRLSKLEAMTDSQIKELNYCSKTVKTLHNTVKEQKLIIEENSVNIRNLRSELSEMFQDYFKTTRLQGPGIMQNVMPASIGTRRLNDQITDSDNIDKRIKYAGPKRSGAIAFTAFVDKTFTLGVLARIPFNTTVLNDGNAFHVENGTFVCPQTGVYLFTFTVGSHGDGFAVNLMVDGEIQLGGVFYTNSTFYPFVTTGNSALLRVYAGQAVWLESDLLINSTVYGVDLLKWTTFSGTLLY